MTPKDCNYLIEVAFPIAEISRPTGALHLRRIMADPAAVADSSLPATNLDKPFTI